jgi:hypothetical protein
MHQKKASKNTNKNAIKNAKQKMCTSNSKKNFSITFQTFLKGTRAFFIQNIENKIVGKKIQFLFFFERFS